jgi:DNA-binding transcriptional LysR family regulator
LRGRLRVGAPDSFGLTCMPHLVQSLRQQCPELEIALVIDNSRVLSQQINDRRLDVAFLANPKIGPHVRVELLGSMELAWIASTRLRLPKYVTPTDLVDQDILTNPEPSNLISIIEHWFATAGLRPSRLGTCTSLSVILRLAAAGAGVTVLPTTILPLDPAAAGLRVLRTRPAVPREQFFAAYLADKYGPGLTTAIKLARQAVAASNLLA